MKQELQKIAERAGRNLGLSLALLNTALAAMLFIQYNPLGIFKSGYEGASLLLDLSQEDVRSIEIADPDLLGRSVRLVRGERLPTTQWVEVNEADESSFFDSIYGRIPVQYRWQLETRSRPRQEDVAAVDSEEGDVEEGSGKADSETDEEGSGSAGSETDAEGKESRNEAGGKAGNESEPSSELHSSRMKESRYPVDIERIAELFEALQNTRRYYAVERTEEKEKELEMIRNSQGNYACLQIILELENGDKHSILVGNRRAGSESYVRLDEERSIYLARSNLRARSGAGDLNYFRDRTILPAEVDKGNVIGFTAKRPSGETIVQMSRKGERWNMQIPPTGGQVASENVDAFVSDLFGWRSRDFLESEPSDMDRRFALLFTLRYNEAGNLTETKRFSLEVLGRKGISDYILRLSPDPSGPSGGAPYSDTAALREITSVALENLLDPIKHFTKREQR